MSPTRAELDAARDGTVPDLLPDPLRLLFVGINPGLWTAAVGAHFARPGNRFYPALHRAGLTREVIDARNGYRPEDLAELAEQGIGITNLCPRPTARADEVTAEELREGAERLRRLVVPRRPRVVAVLGVTAYRRAFRRPGPRPAGNRTRGPGRRSSTSCPTRADSTRTPASPTWRPRTVRLPRRRGSPVARSADQEPRPASASRARAYSSASISPEASRRSRIS